MNTDPKSKMILGENAKPGHELSINYSIPKPEQHDNELAELAEAMRLIADAGIDIKQLGIKEEEVIAALRALQGLEPVPQISATIAAKNIREVLKELNDDRN